MKNFLSALVIAGLAMGVFAKLPPPDAVAKANAGETAAKAAWQAKIDAFELCKVQDKVAAKYGKHNGKQAARPTPVAAKAAASAASAAFGTASSTPIVASAQPQCADPGPFAYNPPEQKPLETSGAHSPAGTAANPPSVRSESATMTPKK